MEEWEEEERQEWEREGRGGWGGRVGVRRWRGEWEGESGCGGGEVEVRREGLLPVQFCPVFIPGGEGLEAEERDTLVQDMEGQVLIRVDGEGDFVLEELPYIEDDSSRDAEIWRPSPTPGHRLRVLLPNREIWGME